MTKSSSGGEIASFAEIRALLGELPGPDLEAAKVAADREGMLIKPAGALGRLEELSCWLAAWQGRKACSAAGRSALLLTGADVDQIF